MTEEVTLALDVTRGLIAFEDALERVDEGARLQRTFSIPTAARDARRAFEVEASGRGLGASEGKRPCRATLGT